MIQAMIQAGQRVKTGAYQDWGVHKQQQTVYECLVMLLFSFSWFCMSQPARYMARTTPSTSDCSVYMCAGHGLRMSDCHSVAPLARGNRSSCQGIFFFDVRSRVILGEGAGLCFWLCYTFECGVTFTRDVSSRVHCGISGFSSRAFSEPTGKVIHRCKCTELLYTHDATSCISFISQELLARLAILQLVFDKPTHEVLLWSSMRQTKGWPAGHDCVHR